MSDYVDCGQIRLYGRDVFEDLNLARTAVRVALYGRSEIVGARIEVTHPTGEVEEWEFGPEVGYPRNSTHNYMNEWIEEYA